LGAHYLSDVLAAILLGVFWLMICAVLLKPIRHSALARATVAVQESRPSTAAASVETVVTT
jgi:membrane-associated phospholipid phosphatase